MHSSLDQSNLITVNDYERDASFVTNGVQLGNQVSVLFLHEDDDWLFQLQLVNLFNQSFGKLILKLFDDRLKYEVLLVGT